MPTTTTTVSRLSIDFPDLGYDGGAGLETVVKGAWTKFGDNMAGRYSESTGIDDSTTVEIAHNFGAAFEEYHILLYTGSHPNLTRVADPTAAGWTIAATSGSEKTSIDVTTPASGEPHSFAVVIIHGATALGELTDVDLETTPPEDGQALIYDSASGDFIPGASGDSSFKIQSVATNGDTVVKGGYLLDNLGREFATYDGSGGASTDFGGDLTIDLDNLVPSPTNDTTYYLYLDTGNLQSAVTASDNGRRIYPVEEAQLVALETLPDAVNLARYIPIGFVRRSTGAWSDTIFGTTATRRHDDPSVVVSPIVYSLSKQSVGSVGTVENTQQALTTGDFPGTTSFFFLDNDDGATITDDSGEANNLTKNGSLAFTGTGLFGRTSVADFDGVDDSLSSSDAFYNPGTGEDLSAGAWIRPKDWNVTQHVLGVWKSSDNNRSWRILLLSSGAIRFNASTNGSTATNFDIAVNLDRNTKHHVVFVYDFSTTTLKGYLDGQLIGETTHATGLFGATADFSLGGEENDSTQYFKGTIEEAFVAPSIALTDAEVNAIYARRYSGPQIRGGHVLDSDSLPSLNSTLYSFWNLNADANDDSGNGRNLTNNGTTPFTGLGIFGTAGAAELTSGSSQYFSTTSSFFSTDQDFTAAIWVAFDSWVPAGSRQIMGNYDAGANLRSWRLVITNSGTILLQTSTDGSTADNSAVAHYLNGWHHMAVSYRASTNTMLVYVDGDVVITHDVTADLYAPSPSLFEIGATDGGSFMDGRVEQALFVKVLLSDLEIKKLASSRLTHSKNVPLASQEWEFNHYEEDSNSLVSRLSSAVLDKKIDTVYLDLLAADNGDLVEGRLYNTGLTAETVPVQTFDRTFTADPGIDVTPIDTYLNADPTYFEVLKFSGGNWSPVADGSSLLDVANTGNRALSGDLSSTSPSPTEPVRVIISCAPSHVAVSNASANSPGLLSYYEESTFTPTFRGSISDPTPTYTTQDGKYTRIGNVVHFRLLVSASASSGGSGDLRIRLDGMPGIDTGSSNRFIFNGESRIGGLITANDDFIIFQASEGSDPMEFSIQGRGDDGAVGSTVAVSDLNSNPGAVWVTGFYFAAV